MNSIQLCANTWRELGAIYIFQVLFRTKLLITVKTKAHTKLISASSLQLSLQNVYLKIYFPSCFRLICNSGFHWPLTCNKTYSDHNCVNISGFFLAWRSILRNLLLYISLIYVKLWISLLCNVLSSSLVISGAVVRFFLIISFQKYDINLLILLP